MVPTDWQQQKASTIAFTELSVSSSSGLLTVSRMLWGGRDHRCSILQIRPLRPRESVRPRTQGR